MRCACCRLGVGSPSRLIPHRHRPGGSNSNRLTSFKSTRFDNPANNVGPMARYPEDARRTHDSSINPSSARMPVARASRLPRASPLPDSPFELLNGLAQDPRAQAPRSNQPAPGCSTQRMFFAVSIVRSEEGSINQASLPSLCVNGRRLCCFPSFHKSPGPKEEGIDPS